MSSNFQQPDRKRHPEGIHRDRWERPIYITPGDPAATTKCIFCGEHVPGVAYLRMTRFISVLEDTHNLENWKLRQVAKGFALRGDLVLSVAAEITGNPDEEDKKALDRLVEDAAEAAGSSIKSNAGTALHRLTERVDRDEKGIVIPPEAERDIAAYRAILASEGLTVDEIEVNVVIDGITLTKPNVPGVGGRFDRIVSTREPCATCGRRRKIADLKTGRIDWGTSKIAMQLAGYSVAKRYNAANGERTELDVCQCWGIVIHLPAGQGQASVHWADLVTARDGLAVAYQVWQWRQAEGLLRDTPPPAPTPDIAGLIRMAGDRESIAGLYDQFAADWTDEHMQLAQQRLAELEAA